MRPAPGRGAHLVGHAQRPAGWTEPTSVPPTPLNARVTASVQRIGTSRRLRLSAT